MKTAIKSVILFSLLLISSTTIFADTSKTDLVEIAKEQRILSQKVAKSYLLLAYGANLQEIKTELQTSITRFESNLDILMLKGSIHFSDIANNTIRKEAYVWYNLKVNVEKAPNTNNLNRVIELSNALLKKSHIAYTALKTEVQVYNSNTIDPNLSTLLKISEKQEILSERLCLYFVAQKINVTALNQNPKILGTLRSVVEKLDKQLIVLLETNINSKETRKIIDEALISFEDIRTNKTDFLDGKPSMNTIYKTTKNLNKLFKVLSSEYTDLASI